ncbi:MAG TPA: LCP family protein [Solirubrobacteraceae bacterium]|nr:LCP family protein [Solirubrobacteraceae bacterium]
MPKTRGGALWRFLLASVLVVGFVAGTTAVAGLLEVQNIVNDFNLTPALKNARVTLPPSGAPQTLLLIGSDHRAGTSYKTSNTDTMMLVRINDNSSTINVLSVPRDLEVQIPVGGVMSTQKINAAYSVGGPNLLIKTIQQQVFKGLQINHIMDVNFRGFSDLIDAIGCVYAMVDRRYYNNTAYTNYSSINIQPGYQRLCGDHQADTGALAFVRYRHTDSDITRNARQQDFIRWAKSQFSTSKILNEQNKLLRIFGKNVQTDHSLHTTDGLINLFNLLINANAHAIRSIPFPATFPPCNPGCYVAPTSKRAEQRAFHTFITPTVAKAKPSSSSTSKKSSGRKNGRSARPPTRGLTSDTADGKSQAAALGGRVSLPIYYPRLIVATSSYCSSVTGNCDQADEPAYEYAHSYPHAYFIKAQNTRYPAYVMTLVANPVLGQYYNVQGTTWKHPPLLSSPTKTQVYNGLKLYEFYNGGKLSMVAVHIGRAAYWISNTLTGSIPASQMIGMAASLTRAG